MCILPYFLASFIAASFASAPELQKKPVQNVYHKLTFLLVLFAVLYSTYLMYVLIFQPVLLLLQLPFYYYALSL